MSDFDDVLIRKRVWDGQIPVMIKIYSHQEHQEEEQEIQVLVPRIMYSGMLFDYLRKEDLLFELDDRKKEDELEVWFSEGEEPLKW